MKTWRKKTGKKKHKLNQPDEFQSFAKRALWYLQENSKRVYIAVGVVVVVVVLTVLVSTLMDSRARNAQAQVSEAVKYYDINSPVPGGKPMAREDRLRKAKELFAKIASEQGGKVGARALYYKANSEMELGEADAAMKDYQGLLGGSSSDPVMKALAKERMAALYIDKGEKDQALKLYGEIASDKDGYMADDAMYRSAKIMAGMGKKDETIAGLQKILKDYPKSPWASESRKMIVEMGGTLPREAMPAGMPGMIQPVTKTVQVPVGTQPPPPGGPGAPTATQPTPPQAGKPAPPAQGIKVTTVPSQPTAPAAKPAAPVKK